MGPTKEKLDALDKKMAELNIGKSDIEYKYIKASGRGGQKVNKSSSAVFARHLPSGLSVKCGKSRSQHLNKFLATRMLVEKVERQMKGEDPEKTAEIEKRIKQKKRRKRKARNKVPKSG
ncbi:MAG: peptide chain release factor-like protein [Desulfobacteraceae bacterium]|nr:MAG: peptide chain release factor-like protein [Desulfobacteraceae bacterium]